MPRLKTFKWPSRLNIVQLSSMEKREVRGQVTRRVFLVESIVSYSLNKYTILLLYPSGVTSAQSLDRSLSGLFFSVILQSIHTYRECKIKSDYTAIIGAMKIIFFKYT